jgi:hypothetical protein
MTSVDLQSDPFQQLLADALRAGPGSPQWHQAVTALRAAGQTSEADEYRLLIAAREHLESGKSYREVRAGAGFTRKVMEQVEAAQTGGGALRSPATWVMLAAVVTLAVVIGLVIHFTRPAEPGGNGATALAQTYFVEPVRVGEFKQQIPAGWQTIGGVAVVGSDRGLRLKTGEGSSKEYEGGGVVAESPVPAGEAFALEAQLRGRVGEEIVPQVFVSESAEFSAERGTSPRELTWMLNDARPVVALPDGRFEGQGDRLKELREPYVVRVLVNDRYAIVESGGQRLWAGEHQLDAGKPRYVGVRFLRKGGRKQDYTSFVSVRVLGPQGTQR